MATKNPPIADEAAAKLAADEAAAKLADDANEPVSSGPDYAEEVAALRAEVAELRERLNTMAPQSGAARVDNAPRFRMSEGERLEGIERENAAKIMGAL